MNNAPLSCKVLLILVLFILFVFAFYKLPFGNYHTFNPVFKSDSSPNKTNNDGMIPNPPFPPYPDLGIEPKERLKFLNLGRSNTVCAGPAYKASPPPKACTALSSTSSD
jgi:hypothetical protein